jgi:6-pyruvoyl-tetrahydropterin synthase
VSGGKCVICGKAIPYNRLICSQKCKEKLKSTILGHKQQAKKISGDNNPAKRPEVKRKIAIAVTKSYINNPKLRKTRGKYLTKNTFGRRFLDGKGNKLKSLIELEVAKHLQTLGLNYEYEPRMFFGGHYVYPDFRISNVIIEVCGYIFNKKTLNHYLNKLRRFLVYTDYDVVFLVPQEYLHNFVSIKKEFDKKGRHVDIFELETSREVELTLENVDTVSYSHFLEWYDGKCKHLHSHTSYNVDLYLQGFFKSKWLVDYKEAKKIAKKVLEKIDHKVVVFDKYVTKKTKKEIYISWKKRELKLLSSDVCIVQFEPTCENITCWLARQMLEKFKEFGVILLSLSFREGINNGVTCYSYIQYYKLKDLERILAFHLFLPKLEFVVE